MEVTQGILLPVLLAAIIVNTAILVAVVVAARSSGRRGRSTRDGTDPTFAGSVLSSSFVDRSARSTSPVGGDRDPETATGLVVADRPMAVPADTDTRYRRRRRGPWAGAVDRIGERGPRRPRYPMAVVPDPVMAVVPDAEPILHLDAMTGLLDQAGFMRLVLAEELRIQRYHRPATIVLFELEGLDRLIDRLGPEAADRIVPALADTIRRLARKPDRVARLAPGRFAVLLSETDEIAAINYVERVRRACELWLESGAIALRLAAGWAGTTGDPTLPDAMRLATDRMYAEVRRQATSRREPEAAEAS